MDTAVPPLRSAQGKESVTRPAEPRRFSRSGRGVLAARAQAQRRASPSTPFRAAAASHGGSWPGGMAPDESAGADAIEDAAEEIVRDRRRGQDRIIDSFITSAGRVKRLRQCQ